MALHVRLEACLQSLQQAVALLRGKGFRFGHFLLVLFMEFLGQRYDDLLPTLPIRSVVMLTE
jgi:hypothetical protein